MPCYLADHPIVDVLIALEVEVMLCRVSGIFVVIALE